MPAKENTRSGRVVFNLKALYLKIGEQYDQLLEGIPLADLDPTSSISPAAAGMLALVTLFQYVESLPDWKAAEALRTRMDWKFALHLPLAYSGLRPITLLEFRQSLLQDRRGKEALGQIIARLASTGLLGQKMARLPSPEEVLGAVEGLSRLERLADSMTQALEAIASAQPDWLLQVSLPYWYVRYRPGGTSIPLPSTPEDQAVLTRTLYEDTRHLLEAIDKASDPALRDLPEIQALRRVYLERP